MELYGIEKMFIEKHRDEKFDRVFILEDVDCSHIVFTNIKDAFMYTAQLINEDTAMTPEQKCDAYSELFTSYLDRDIDRWGEGFTIDDYVWCYETSLYKGKRKGKENKNGRENENRAD